ncbi:MAG TPA: GNAT family N-acetyltransferase [Chloroflexota bacterium]|nr:GNAT family N-acetyltransferase [Chloroflexota bacterium]
MATTMLLEKVEPERILIRMGEPEDAAAAEELWESTGARPCAHGEPVIRLVARNGRTNEFLGVADCFRTFPPEDAMGGVAVVPDERRHGVGAALLRELARMTVRNGRRVLAGFMHEDDAATLHLLRATGLPVRLHPLEGGLYYEIDLVPRAL